MVTPREVPGSLEFYPFETHFPIIVILIEDGDLLGPQVLDGVTGQEFRLIRVIGIGDESPAQLVLRILFPDPDIAIGGNQRDLVFGKKIFRGVDNGRSQQGRHRKHIALHFRQIGHGARRAVAVITEDDIDLATVNATFVVDVIGPCLGPHAGRTPEGRRTG
jgi:hypothetical protein